MLGMVRSKYESEGMKTRKTDTNRDVAAGIAILEEAGGLVTTANPPDDPNADIPTVKLGSRLYLAIRCEEPPLLYIT